MLSSPTEERLSQKSSKVILLHSFLIWVHLLDVGRHLGGVGAHEAPPMFIWGVFVFDQVDAVTAYMPGKEKYDLYSQLHQRKCEGARAFEKPRVI